ncbi:AMIN-like domain-containing (lipo)protein [Nesterenkonia alba]|uniref:AMIN-like domain-containing (lipo)protein n=1 Tax=Nesterenkonia alba TaxID=515814 RepID=UPI0004165195|nr:hypothetical protein [Nesterenkonia alba]
MNNSTAPLTAAATALALAMSACGEAEDLPEAEDTETTDAEAGHIEPETTGDDAHAGDDETGPADEPEETPDDDGAEHHQDTGTDTEGEAEEDTGEAADGAEDVTPEEFSTQAQESDGFPDGGDAAREQQLTEIRHGVHEGYERVVFEYAGPGAVSYRAEYVDEVSTLGVGEPVDIAGEAILQIDINGPNPQDQAIGTGHYLQDQGVRIADLYVQGPFEGHSQYAVGVDTERPFHIFTLEDDDRLRVVVDIATE